MDLRRSVLTKQNNVLCETSLNISSASAYESAVDDSNSSLYYSFTNDSTSTIDATDQDSNDFSNQSMSSEADKENTVIMRKEATPVEDGKMIHDWEKNSVGNFTEKTEEVAKLQVALKSDKNELVEDITELTVEPVKEAIAEEIKVEHLVVQQDDETVEKVEIIAEQNSETATKLGEKLETAKLSLIPENDETLDSPEKPFEATSETETTRKSIEIEKSTEVSDSFPEMPRHLLNQVESSYNNLVVNVEVAVDIVIHDPNENIINPFTAPVDSPVIVPQPEKRVTRRSVLNTLIPAKAGFYSPVLRKSLERKIKVTNKPQNTRRTLYGPMKVPAASKPKTPTQIPQPTTVIPAVKPVASKPLLKPAVKPKIYKCTEAGCVVEVATVRALQDHLKQHKSSTSQACKFCDIKFQLESALINHQTEKCSRIPFNEKRKLLAQRDKKEKDRRGTALFTVPVPKRKSPSRRQSTAPKLNKSGIMITPRKSLKCHICKAIVPDALSLANHILAHKFNKTNNEQA